MTRKAKRVSTANTKDLARSLRVTQEVASSIQAIIQAHEKADHKVTSRDIERGAKAKFPDSLGNKLASKCSVIYDGPGMELRRGKDNLQAVDLFFVKGNKKPKCLCNAFSKSKRIRLYQGKTGKLYYK